jgi:hypothetical protein
MMGILREQAEELGIEVDDSWGAVQLKAAIAEARKARMAGGAGNDSDDGVEVTLKRDFWRGEDDRVAAGMTIVVARAKARDLLANDVIEAPGF